jgi:hypothetical protein
MSIWSISWQFSIVFGHWVSLWPFGICYDHLLYIFSPFWYVVPRKIWQPCLRAFLSACALVPAIKRGRLKRQFAKLNRTL